MKKIVLLKEDGTLKGAWIMTFWTGIIVLEYILAIFSSKVLNMLDTVGSQQVTIYCTAIALFLGTNGLKGSVDKVINVFKRKGDTGEKVSSGPKEIID